MLQSTTKLVVNHAHYFATELKVKSNNGKPTLEGRVSSNNIVKGDNLAEWLRRLTWMQKVPGSDIWCSCHNLLRGGAVAMVTELALN